MVDGTQIVHAIPLLLYRNSHVRKVVSMGAATSHPAEGGAVYKAAHPMISVKRGTWPSQFQRR